jgi:hypothetical protein
MKTAYFKLFDQGVVWCRRLQVMTRKELFQLTHDIPLLIFFIYSFTLAVYITGTGVSTQLKMLA